MIVGILAIIFFSTIFSRAVFYAPQEESDGDGKFSLQIIDETHIERGIESVQESFEPQITQSILQAKKVYPSSYPSQLRIPSIDVSADVQYVGITKKGNMATPNNFRDVGWYKNGVIPGEVGSAIIAGHVNNGLALPAIFYNLEDIKIGDDIYLDNVGKDTLNFVVTDIKIYDFNAKSEEVFNQVDGKFLKLITCTGVWQKEFKTHDKRLVVIAELK